MNAFFKKGEPPQKLAEPTSMKRKMSRILLALSLVFSLCFCFSLVTCATETTEATQTWESQNVDDYLDDMADEIYLVYKTLRDRIAIPLIIISIASCGFQMLFSVFTETGPNPMARATKQFMTSLVALAVLFVLPHVIGAIRELLESSAWTPHATSAIFLPLSFFIRRWS